MATEAAEPGVNAFVELVDELRGCFRVACFGPLAEVCRRVAHGVLRSSVVDGLVAPNSRVGQNKTQTTKRRLPPLAACERFCALIFDFMARVKLHIPGPIEVRAKTFRR